MALRDRRKDIIAFVKDKAAYLRKNHEVLDIYEGNLLPYIDAIMQASLSENYYNAIKDRILPINVLQRYMDKVSCTYSKEPKRQSKSKNKANQDFVDYYKEKFCMDQSGQIADVYSNLFKAFAWEPYVDKNGQPALRELPFDSFMVMSDSKTNPEEETVFIKLMGKKGDSDDSMLLHVYTDDEFDAFYMDESEDSASLLDNQGVNVIGTIPFVYGKRQKRKLIPTQDSDILKFTKAIPVMLSDAAGAQMFQCFSILYGIDVTIENAKMSPNVLWSIKSDKESTKEPKLGTIKPEASTTEVVQFVISAFVLWLETKGVRVGSIGSIDAGNLASGISKIVDEMDVFEIIKKSQEWFEKDEAELWNIKMPKIHNYWIKSNMVRPSEVPGIVPENTLLDIDISFEEPSPMKSRTEEVAEVKAEVDLGTMTMEQAVRKLHPDYDDNKVKETLSNRVIV